MQSNKIIREYARLIARKGVNVQKDQDVVIFAELDQPKFVNMLVSECYQAGAARVTVEWQHQPNLKLDIHYQSVDALSAMFAWEYAKWEQWAQNPPSFIYILSDDPDGLKNVDQVRYTIARTKRAKEVQPYLDRMDTKHPWCIAAVPGKKWAKKLFPELRSEKAVEKLWEMILKSSRADVDPIAQWNDHNKELHKRCDYLNSLGIDSLHYYASNGTDLTVRMMTGSKFIGGEDKTIFGQTYNANIPSEEIFTTPLRTGTEGVVYSSMPLAHQGALIEDIRFVFKEGKITEASSSSNFNMLKKLITSDEGASYLGECALVPYDSPINQTGILFYNTLFDENASCHLALGRGFPESIVGFENLSIDELTKRGMNNSVIHVDFMIGTEDLNIDAVTSFGETVPIFTNGLWTKSL